MPRQHWAGWLAVHLAVASAALFADERPAPAGLTVRGILQPAEEIALRSPLDARVVAVHVETGQEVEAGQVLVELDPAPLEQGLVQAAAGVRQAAAERTLVDSVLDRTGRTEERLRTDLGIARSLLNRAESPALPGHRGRDGSRRSIMRAPLEESADERAAAAETEVRKALLQARIRRSMVESLQEDFDRLEAEAQVAKKTAAEVLERFATMTAPVSGTVSRCTIRPEERVSRGQPVATLVETKRVKALLWIPSSWVSVISKGTRVSIRPEGADRRPCEGEISRISVQPHPRTGQYLAEVLLTNDDARLQPGLFVDATIGPVRAKTPAASP